MCPSFLTTRSRTGTCFTFADAAIFLNYHQNRPDSSRPPSVGAHEGAHVLVAVLAKEIQRPTQTSAITAQRLSWLPSRRRITSPTITITTAGIAIRFHFLHSFESLRFSSLVYSHSLKAFDFHQ